MKTKYFRLFVFFLFLLSTFSSLGAEDLRRIVSLSGSWRFSIGNDSKWASPSFNDSDWDQISVPGKWEDQGYNDYNGYAWYRKSFIARELPENTTIYLVMGRIDDADEIYLNGKLIGKSGKFPPNFKTAYDRTRKYIVPADYIKKDDENLISVKVYDSYLDGGIIDGPAGLFIDEDNELLNLNLSGKWKFRTGNDKSWKSYDLNDDTWNSIDVPSVWENEGYEDYDGYAWYRLDFRLPDDFPSGELYLSLGKVDDYDDVYLNGDYIGNVYDLKRNNFSRGKGWEYSARRIYKIPEGLLKKNAKNTLAVRVYDEQEVGGIYEGPIGIMTAENSRKYRNKHHSEVTRYGSFWEYMYDKFFGNDNLIDN